MFCDSLHFQVIVHFPIVTFVPFGRPVHILVYIFCNAWRGLVRQRASEPQMYCLTELIPHLLLILLCMISFCLFLVVGWDGMG